MKCQACQVLVFQPLDKVQKLASSEGVLSQTLGTSLAITRKAVEIATSTKGLEGGIRKALGALPPKVESKIRQPRLTEVLHNSVYVHHPSLKALELSAAAGCDFCRLVWGGLKNPLPQTGKENRLISQDVRLYLSSYRSLGPERSLSRLTDQYITAECGADRSMCLEISVAGMDAIKKTTPARARDSLLKKAVRGFPQTKRNKDGTFKIDISQVDLNKVDFKMGYGSAGKTSMKLIFKQGRKTKGQMIEESLKITRSLNGPIEYTAFDEGSEVTEDLHTGSKANMKRAIGWLNICLQTHDLCTCTTDLYTPLPTRVIDLGSSNESRAPYIYRSRGEHSRYVTLSHRWAGNSVVKTTKENLWLHERRLPLQDLSLTFREAIEVCRELCVRYLWIDSLCIIQNSREDWEKESSKMGDYYWNSLFTIAADNATEEHQGCFRRRDPCSIQPGYVAFTFPQDIDRALGAARVTARIQEKEDWRHKPYSILDTRSWVLQERILSPRTLFFGEHQLSFSCISMRASENIPEGSDRSGIKVQAAFEEFQRKIRLYAISILAQTSSPEQRASAQLPTPTVKINAQNGQVNMSIHPEVNTQVDPRFQRDMYDNWYDLLIEYNKRSITQKSDVLPALSGLAMRFQQTIGDTYLAGLWSGDLKAGLLWSVDGSSQRSITYRAPSWSWASIRTCRLRMNYNHEKVTSTNLSDIYNADVTYRGANVFGEVLQGALYVKGFLKKATVVCPPRYINLELARSEKPDMDVRDEWNSDLSFREVGDSLLLEKEESAFLQDPGTGEQLSTFEPDDSSDFSLQGVWCLPLVTQQNMFGDEAALSLVLQPSLLGENSWCRVGFARMPKVDWFNDAVSYDIALV